MAESVGLLFKVTADTKDGQEQFKRFGENIENATSKLKTEIGGRFTSLAQSIGVSTTALTGMAVGIGVLFAGFEKLAEVTIEAGKFLFELAEKSAEAGNKIFELSERTNLSAETLSVLKVAADRSGSSIEAVGQNLVKFNGSLIDAANGNKKLSEALQRMGIDAKTAFQNPDQAISTFIAKFNQLPPSLQKNRDEMLLFRDKTGELIPTIKAIGGSFDEFKEKLDSLGLLMSGAEVENAHAFSVQLSELGAVAERVGAKFANQFTPELTAAMRDTESELANNQKQWYSWGNIVTDVIGAVRLALRSYINLLNGADFRGLVPRTLEIMNADDAQAELPTLGEVFKGGTQDRSAGPGPGGGGGGSNKKDNADRDANKEAKLAEADLAETVRAATVTINDNYKQRRISLEQYIDQLKKVATSQHESTIAELADEERKIAGEKESGKLKGQALLNAEEELRQKRVKAENKFNEESAKLDEDAADKRVAEIRQRNAEANALADDFDGSRIAKIKETEAKVVQGHAEAAQQIANIEALSRARIITGLEDELTAATGNADEQAKITAELNILRQKDVTDREQAQRQIQAGRVEDVDEYRKYLAATKQVNAEIATAQTANKITQAEYRIQNHPQLGSDRLESFKALADAQKEAENQTHQRNVEAINEEIATDLKLAQTQEQKLQTKRKYDALTEAEQLRHDHAMKQIDEDVENAKIDNSNTGQFLSGMFGPGFKDQILQTQTTLQVFGSAVANVFSGIGQAVGQAVRNFALLGNSGTSFRKFAAEVIASVAQMAAVQAVFELAQGLAASALFWFTGDPRFAKAAADHYLAAVVYGAIAGVAAVAGRVAAGNAFQTQQPAAGNALSTGSGSSGSGGSSSSGKGGDYYSSKDEESITQNRWGQMSQSDRNLVRVIELRVDKGLIVQEVHNDINNGSPLRDLIIRTVQR